MSSLFVDDIFPLMFQHYCKLAAELVNNESILLQTLGKYFHLKVFVLFTELVTFDKDVCYKGIETV